MAKMMGLLAVLVGVVATVFGVVYQQCHAYGSFPVPQWSNLWYGDEAVKAGGVFMRGNTPYELLNALDKNLHYWQTFKYAFLAIVGEVYIPSVFRTVDLDFSKERDDEGKFCRSLLDYFWVFPTHPMNRGTREDMADFVRFCREEYGLLSAEEQGILAPLRAAGTVPHSILLPNVAPEQSVKEDFRKSPLPAYCAEKLELPELQEMISASANASTWQGTSLPDAVLKHYSSLNLRRVEEVNGSWPAIAQALREGRIARFDAKGLVPAELVNAAPAQLAQREGEAAERIPVLADTCSAMSMREWGQRTDELLRSGAKVSWSLADRQSMFREGEPDVPREAREAMDRAGGTGKNGYCDAGYLHTRRMPRLHASLPDVAKELGMEDEILRVQSFLWMGAVRGGFHYDEEANVYIQLVGEADVWLLPQNYTNPLLGGARRAELPSEEQLRSDPLWKEVPLHLLRLKPGEGVTFPSFTYHLVCAQSVERVALNFFFMPKWRKMEFSAADWYPQEAKRPHGLERLAIRQLWARSFARLWDEKKRGLIVNAHKNEYL